jgi:hypothetical protein
VSRRGGGKCRNAFSVIWYLPGKMDWHVNKQRQIHFGSLFNSSIHILKWHNFRQNKSLWMKLGVVNSKRVQVSSKVWIKPNAFYKINVTVTCIFSLKQFFLHETGNVNENTWKLQYTISFHSAQAVALHYPQADFHFSAEKSWTRQKGKKYHNKSAKLENNIWEFQDAIQK